MAVVGAAPNRSSERGAVLVVITFAVVAMAALAAVVIDLSALRNDRADNQAAADSAATAGILAYTRDGGEAACRQALGYLEAVLGSPVVGVDCGAFPDRCRSSTASATLSGTSGAFAISIVHPVDDDDPLMASGAIGAAPVPLTRGDGDRCERLGVSVTETHETFFGGLFGVEALETTVHAVALDGTDRSPARVPSVAVLDPSGCEVLTATGSGEAGIHVGQLVDDRGRVYPGWLAVDSDGGGGCGPKGVVDVRGANSWIRVDGPGGCAGEVGPAGSGQGCGRLEVLAPGTPGCSLPACSNGGSISPSPTSLEAPITRAPADHRWNCKASYPVALGTGRCFLAGHEPPYIDQLVGAVGATGVPAGFSSYVSRGYPCTVGNGDIVTIPQGNWVVDCPLRVAGFLTFAGGNLVLDEGASVQSTGQLWINRANTANYAWVEGTNLDIGQSSSGAGFVLLRSGDLSKSGQGRIRIQSTMFYVPIGSALDLSGGPGAVQWSSPREGPFADLALWYESNADIRLGGQASLSLDGVFFAPKSALHYIGNGQQNQTAGQYLVRQLHVVGQGRFEISPDPGRSVAVPTAEPTILIR